MMYWKYFLIFLSSVTIIQANQSCPCIVDDNSKIRIFQTLVKYQANKLSFNPHDPTYDGNYVSFSFTAIDRLPKNAFVSYTSQNVIGLNLSNKSIKEIDKDAFLSLSCLYYLDLSNNHILNLTKNVFFGLDNLKTLNISRNNLTYLYQSVFYNLKNIEVLDISYNNISDLDKNALSDLSQLKKLILSYNCMKRISFAYFNQLVNLRELYLDHNEIAIVPTFFFRENKFLEKLDLSGTGLVLFDMETNQSVLPSVKNLNLSDNYLMSLHVENISYSFPNKDLTIDFNNNKFYCSSWNEYLEEFKEKHIKIAPGRNFTQSYYINGIACNIESEESDAKLKEDDKQYEATLNHTLKSIVQELNHKKGELSGKQPETISAAPNKSPLVQQGNSTTPIKESIGKSGSSTTKGVTISLAVIAVAFLVLVSLDYVLGVGFMVKFRERIRYFLSSAGAGESAEYVTLTHPS